MILAITLLSIFWLVAGLLFYKNTRELKEEWKRREVIQDFVSNNIKLKSDKYDADSVINQLKDEDLNFSIKFRVEDEG